MTASALRPARATASTRWCSASSPAPTATASRAWRPPATRPRRCVRSSEPARTSSPRASGSPTSCAPSSTRSGPAPRRIFADIDSPIALAFLERYPSPSRRARPRPQAPRRLSRPPRLLRPPARRRSCSTGCAARPAPSLGELETEARRSRVLGLVAALRPIVEQISQLTSQIRGAIARHPDGPDLPELLPRPQERRSAPPACWPRSATTAPATRAATASPPTPAKPPSPSESGKHRAASFRWACDKRLRNHIGVLADSTRHWHPWAHDIYQRARDRGCDHPHALRILGRAWTRVLWRCWQDHTSPTTPPDTERPHATSPPTVDTGRLTPPPSACSSRRARAV